MASFALLVAVGMALLNRASIAKGLADGSEEKAEAMLEPVAA